MSNSARISSHILTNKTAADDGAIQVLTESVVETVSVEVGRQRADTRRVEVLDVVVPPGNSLRMCRLM